MSINGELECQQAMNETSLVAIDKPSTLQPRFEATHCVARPIMAEVKGATCSNCGKSGQLHQCIGCIESQVINGDIVPASYCSKACQSAHWKQHKKVCVVRKRLRRAGDLLKTVWLAFREEAFDICLTQVGWEGSKLHTYEGEYAATDVLVRFPHHLVSSPVDREMVLSHRACSDAPADTFNVSKKVLESA